MMLSTFTKCAISILMSTLLIMSCHVDTVSGDKIVAVTFPQGSHIFPVVQIDKALKRNFNHSISFVIPKYMMSNPLFKNNDVDVIYAKKLEESDIQRKTDNVLQRSVKGEQPVIDTLNLFGSMCENVLGDEELMLKLQKERFDMLIIHSAFTSDCLNYIGYKLSIPIVHYGAFYEPLMTGTPFNPFVTPDYPFADYGESMTFVQRLKNTLVHYIKPVIFSLVFPSDLCTKYVPEKPFVSIRDMRRRVSFNLIDFDVLMDYPRPILPNAAFVGGLNTRPAEPLTEEFQEIMDSATDGVVIVTFGSIIKSVPPEKLEKLTAAMKKVKSLTFVMSFGKEKTTDGNIIMRPWIPQNDLLAHKNTRAFITHCGNGGQFEALYHGVPMIGVPINGDEPYNAERMKNRKYGLYMPLSSLETEAFTEIIRDVAFNPMYSKNIKKASDIFHSRPLSPPDSAAYWIDHVLNFGGEYLHSIAPSLPWYRYFGVDVYSFFALCMSLLSYVFYLIFRKLKQRFCRKKQNEKVKTN